MSKTQPTIDDPLALRRPVVLKGRQFVRGEEFPWRELGIRDFRVRAMIDDRTLGHRDVVQAKYGRPGAVETEAEVLPEIAPPASEGEPSSPPPAETAPSTEPTPEAPIEPRIVSAAGSSAGAASSGPPAPEEAPSVMSPTSVSPSSARRRPRG